MHLVELIEKLNHIDQAIGQVDSTTLKRMVMEAQNCALQMQRETVEQMRRESRHVFYSPEPTHDGIRKADYMALSAEWSHGDLRNLSR